MTANPIDLVLVDNVRPIKSDVRGFEKLRGRQRVANAAEVNTTDFTGQFGGLYVATLGAMFDLDAADTTSADNGTTILVDSTGHRFKLAASAPAITNTRLAKTAAYTVTNADKGKTAALAGAAFYALTFNAASGYDANFSMLVVNEDTRGKTMTIPGIVSFILYPGQAIFVFNQNSVWRMLGAGRWKVAGGTQNLFTDFTNGNDANDGLAAGTGNAKKTVQAALDTIANDFDLTSYAGLTNQPSGPTLVVINMAAGVTDTQGVHFSAHGTAPGAQGGAAIKILGGAGAKITVTGGDCLGIFCNAQVQISGVELSTITSGDCIVVDRGGQVDVLTNVVFAACAGSHMSAVRGKIIVTNNYSVKGNATVAHMLAQTPGAAITGAGITMTLTGNSTVGWWTLAANLAGIVMTTYTVVLGAFAVTGKRYQADGLGLISTNGGGANYFPGNAAGSTSGGGQYI